MKKGDSKKDEKQWKMFPKYVGVMIRKILYFLLRRINFSPEKNSSSSKKYVPSERKKNFSLVGRAGEAWGEGKVPEKFVEKENSRDVCIYNKAIIFVRNLI